MYNFSKSDVADKIKSVSKIEPNGCWTLVTDVTKAMSMRTPDGAYYQRTFRQWGYWYQTNIDLYKTGKRVKNPVCRNLHCVNPDHQNLNFMCQSVKKKKKTKIKFIPKKKYELNTDGSLKFW